MQNMLLHLILWMDLAILMLMCLLDRSLLFGKGNHKLEHSQHKKISSNQAMNAFPLVIAYMALHA